LCRELINVDLGDANGREVYGRKDIHNKYCVDFVAEAVRIAHEVIKS
jgi:hypothetical protein